MALNLELIEELKRRVISDPINFDMDLPIRKTSCGTTACFAGHITLIALEKNGRIDIERDKKFFIENEPIASIGELQGAEWTDIEWLATKALGIEDYQAKDLFFSERWWEPFKTLYEQARFELHKVIDPPAYPYRETPEEYKVRKERILEVKREMAQIACDQLDCFVKTRF
ncbi:MAG: hypothetical protein WBB28_20650 [Crinalium sp.]